MSDLSRKPTPRRSIKRQLKELDPETSDAGHKRLERSVHVGKSVTSWLQGIPRSSSVASEQDVDSPECQSRSQSASLHLSTAVMSRGSDNPEDCRQSTASKTTLTHLSTRLRLYRSTLVNHQIFIDRTGRAMTQELTAFVKSRITKDRGFPPLPQRELDEVLSLAERLADGSEGTISKTLDTPMFPFRREGIAEGGGNTPWTRDALPTNLDYPNALSTPKPNRHFGYPSGQATRFNSQEEAVINQPYAITFTQPAIGNSFTAIAIELASEIAGGSIREAEYQAAGSGTESVNCLRWLLSEAKMKSSASLTDTVAFTIALSVRQVILYIHWYSEEQKAHWMSYVNSYSPLNSTDIQQCNRDIENILDVVVGQRHDMIKKALSCLFPFPQHWSKKRRSTSSAASTPATSSFFDISRTENQETRTIVN